MGKPIAFCARTGRPKNAGMKGKVRMDDRSRYKRVKPERRGINQENNRCKENGLGREKVLQIGRKKTRKEVSPPG